jgi:Fe-S-cluster containining protein
MTEPNLQRNTLARLHADIDTRVQSIRDDHRDWLCRMGCDGCCRRLAEVPRLTFVEWELLKEGLAALPSDQIREIGRDIAALAEQPARPIVCPLLDRSAGACRVYAHRPVACRTYGFYVQRGLGLYCKDIESRVAEGAWVDVVWGNQDAIDRRLQGFGDARELTEWFGQWQKDGDPA